MTDPFRDSETTALARVDELEAENQRLTEELEEARNLVGENHQAFVKHLEDQLVDLKRENKHLQTRLDARVPVHPNMSSMTPQMLKSQERMSYVIFGGMGF